jgi:hypothetical protein
MAHSLRGNDTLALLAAEATRPVLDLAESSGGDAGRALVEKMYGPDSSMGELELRLALGALATAVIDLRERVAEIEADD